MFGRGERAVRSLAALHEHGVLGVSPPGDQFEEACRRRGIECLQDSHLAHVRQRLVATSPCLVVLAGYPKLLGPEFTESFFCVNMHAGPLPRYRGPHPMNWVLINGENETAFTMLRADTGVDTGPILAQEWFSIGPDTTYTDLYCQSLVLYPKMLGRLVRQFSEGTMRLVPQDRNAGFWCSRRYPTDNAILWSQMTAQEVHNLVRSQTPPSPGAYTILHSNLLVNTTRMLKRQYHGVPGRIAARWASGLVVCCKDRGILVTHLRAKGSDVILPAAAYNFRAGETL